jgi:hypothetical protein
VQKLHLVGFTTDHEGLILSARRGARSGAYLIEIDDSIEAAVDELRARRAAAAGIGPESADDDAESDVAEHRATAVRAPRVESALSVREIQARLRGGRTVAEVAKAAGVDSSWVERFAPPVLAERAQVIAKVHAMPLRRSRLGDSSLPIGDAVRRHLADRGVTPSPDEYADLWSAQQVDERRWAVRCTYRYRGRDHQLRYDLDETTGTVEAADRTSGIFGYLAPVSGAAPVAPPDIADAQWQARLGAASAGPAPVRTTARSRAVPPAKPAKAVRATAKAAARRAAARERAAAKKAADTERARARATAKKAADSERARARAAAK